VCVALRSVRTHASLPFGVSLSRRSCEADLSSFSVPLTYALPDRSTAIPFASLNPCGGANLVYLYVQSGWPSDAANLRTTRSETLVAAVKE
jgi:hypothetical protein